MKIPFQKKPRTKLAPHREEPPLPPGYIVVHYGPNRAMRRAAKRIQRALYRKHETWVRSLLAAGVDVEKVLAEKEKKLNELATKPTSTDSHVARRRGTRGSHRHGNRPRKRAVTNVASDTGGNSLSAVPGVDAAGAA